MKQLKLLMKTILCQLIILHEQDVILRLGTDDGRWVRRENTVAGSIGRYNIGVSYNKFIFYFLYVSLKPQYLYYLYSVGVMATKKLLYNYEFMNEGIVWINRKSCNKIISYNIWLSKTIPPKIEHPSTRLERVTPLMREWKL